MFESQTSIPHNNLPANSNTINNLKMALRAFRSNPCLGGFGSETHNGFDFSKGTNYTIQGNNSKQLRKRRKTNNEEDQVFGNGDAFAQIVKELVDNAVDACSISHDNSSETKRVRVVIEPVDPQQSSSSSKDVSSNCVLRVTVTDNGCGMSNIHECVSVFHSSKGEQEEEKQTAGRYGLGLTL